jgi:hypothetical protein
MPRLEVHPLIVATMIENAQKHVIPLDVVEALARRDPRKPGGPRLPMGCVMGDFRVTYSHEVQPQGVEIRHLTVGLKHTWPPPDVCRGLVQAFQFHNPIEKLVLFMVDGDSPPWRTVHMVEPLDGDIEGWRASAQGLPGEGQVDISQLRAGRPQRRRRSGRPGRSR